MKRDEFIHILNKHPLLIDGGIESEIYRRGVYININYNGLNVDNPNFIKEIHRDYCFAGADILKTNTFGANRAKLSLFGLQDKVGELNFRGVELLREVREESRRNFLIAGVVSPTAVYKDGICQDDLKSMGQIFKEQIDTLIAGGVDLILLETFDSLVELEIAIFAARQLSQDIPLIASLTFPENNKTIFGKSIAEVTEVLNNAPVEIIGFNCSRGPQNALKLLKEFNEFSDKKIIVMPNTGYPTNVNGLLLNMSNREMFGSYATKYLRNGASIIGGCCGVTPEFICQMKKSINQYSPRFDGRTEGIEFKPLIRYADISGNRQKKNDITFSEVEKKVISAIPLWKRSKLGFWLYKQQKTVISMEVLSPKNLSVAGMIKKVNSLKGLIDLINIPDGPRASARMGMFTAGYLINKNCGTEVITHYSCRDRNILGIQSDLLSIHALGLRNILAVTGDPPKLGNYPDATAVFDVDSIGLVKILSNLNKGFDIAGNSIGKKSSFLIGVGVNPASGNMERELKRLALKIKAGAEFIMTQPVYDAEVYERFYAKIKKYKIPVIIGISPLISYQAAEFQNNEIPGMEVPQVVLEKLKYLSGRGDPLEYGIKISVELLEKLKGKYQGIYFMVSTRKERKAALEIIKRSDEIVTSK